VICKHQWEKIESEASLWPWWLSQTLSFFIGNASFTCDKKSPDNPECICLLKKYIQVLFLYRQGDMGFQKVNLFSP